MSPVKLVELLANSYHDAALGSMDMHVATESLESVRSAAVSTTDAFSTLDLVDNQIGLTSLTRLREILVELRERLEDCLVDTELERLAGDGAGDAISRWESLLLAFVRAINAWRPRVALGLCLSSKPEETEQKNALELMQSGARSMLEQRWAESYDLFIYLSAQDVVSKLDRAKVIVSAAEVQLYHFLRPDAARELLDRASVLAPDDVRIQCGWAEFWLEQPNYQEARRSLDLALSHTPRSADACAAMGDYHLKRNEFSDAQRWFREAIQTEPGQAAGYTGLIRLCRDRHWLDGHEDEIPVLVDRIAAVSSSAESGRYFALLEAGLAYEQAGVGERALEHYDQAVRAHPQRPEAYLYEGYVHLRNANLPAARTSIERAHAVAPDSFDALWALASLAEQEKNLHEALRWYSASLKLRANRQGDVRAQMANVLRQLGRSEEAERELFDALKAEPGNDHVLDALYNLAEEGAASEDAASSALRVYARIREIRGPQYEPEFHNRLGKLHQSEGRNAEAAAEFRKAIDASPHDPLYHSNLASALQELGEWDNARSELDVATRLPGGDAYRHDQTLLANAEGNSLFERGEFDAAIQRYTEATTLDSQDAVLWSNLARAWESLDVPGQRLESLKSALSAIEHAVALDPDEPEYAKRARSLRSRVDLAGRSGELLLDVSPVLEPVVVAIAEDLVTQITVPDGLLSGDVTRLLTGMRQGIRDDLGVTVPGLRFRRDPSLPEGSYVIQVNGHTVASGSVSRGAEPEGPNGEAGETSKSVAHLLRDIERLVRRNVSEFIGHHEVVELLAGSPERRDQVAQSKGALTALVRVVKGLLSSGVTVESFDSICDRAVELHNTRHDPVAIVEELRLMPEMRTLLPGSGLEFNHVRFSERVETEFAGWIVGEGSGIMLISPPRERLVRAAIAAVAAVPNAAVVVGRVALRPFVAALLESSGLSVPVLARRECAPERQQPVELDVGLWTPVK